MRLLGGALAEAAPGGPWHAVLVRGLSHLRRGGVLQHALRWSGLQRRRLGHRAAVALQHGRRQERPLEARLRLRLGLFHWRVGQHGVRPRRDELGERRRRRRWSLAVERARGHRVQRGLGGLGVALRAGAQRGTHRGPPARGRLRVRVRQQHAEGIAALQVSVLRFDPSPGGTGHGAMDRLPLLHPMVGALLLYPQGGGLHVRRLWLGHGVLQHGQRLAAEFRGAALPGPRSALHRQLLRGERRPLPPLVLLRLTQAGRLGRRRQRGAPLLHRLPVLRPRGSYVRHLKQENLL
mmetsp:Transcript_89572/g.175322  ORF Transcript_89572/g.175322 Transcript_89572/m.175322 type:complete len:293 (+) Transcript_89572:367-1245(+)